MNRSIFHACTLALFVSLLASAAPGQSVTLVDAFPQLTFYNPIFLTHAGDGSDRIFVVQQNGSIFVFPNDSAARSAPTFLDIGHKLSSSTGEEGLLGLAFHPQYKTNGYFYVNYTAPNPLRTVVARFKVSATNRDSADPSSGFKIIEIGQPFTNHNGGMIAFGPDGYLYIGMGDGGSEHDPNGYGQSRTTLLAKMLRIDVNDTTPTTHYRIPPDNPYAGNSSGWKQEIWAYGLRNPWRWSFDPPTGALWAGDVGQDTQEEIDVITKGGNYGWNIMEGFICQPPSTTCDSTGMIPPIAVFIHEAWNAIVGGYVYHGDRQPWLAGAYIFGDYQSGQIWMLRYANGVVTADSMLWRLPNPMSSFGIDQQNELYMVSYASPATIYRFAGGGPTSGVRSSAPPSRFLLEQNYPNPFNPATTISYALPGTARVSLRVFDILGREVATLVDAVQEGGSHTASFGGGNVSSGVYVYRLVTPYGSLSRSMLLLR